MSEHKRLSDEAKAALRAEIHAAGSRTVDILAVETRLEMDHDQARGDVERLAARLRALTPIGSGHDRECVGHFAGTMPPGCDCKTGRLLAEVDPK